MVEGKVKVIGVDLAKQSDIAFSCVVEAEVEVKGGVKELISRLRIIKPGSIEIGKEAVISINEQKILVKALDSKRLQVLKGLT